MKAFNCFLMICGVLLSSDFAFGASLGIDKLVSEKKEDAAAVTFEDAIAPITNDLLKKAEERIAEVKESLIREINNQNNEDSLIQNPQNKTTKQLKIVGDKLVQTEEKVVSLGTKDNATIAIYKIINIRPLSFLVKTENSKPNKPVEQASENPNKSLDELEKSQPLAENQQSSQNDQPDQQDHSAKNESPENDKPAQKDDSAQNEQSAQQEQPAQNETAQNDQPTQQDQTAQNESAQNGPVISITGPDGVPRVIHGIAIKVAPKSDGTQDKDKPDIHSKEDKIPLEVSNNLDHTEMHENAAKPSTISKINSAMPVDTEGSHSQGEALVTSYWQPAARDLSKDTLINDRISQQQASAGVVKIDPDAEFIDPEKHKGHIAQDTRTNFKYNARPFHSGADRDVEEVESENYNSLDEAPVADLTGDILVNEHMDEKLTSGAIRANPDAEFIDPKQHEGHMARQRTRVNLKHTEPSGILSRFGADQDHDVEEVSTDSTNSFDQTSAGADLSRDILVNEHAANQVAAGLVNADPDAEFISLDRPSGNKNYKNYYYVPDTVQQVPVVDLTRDSSVSVESFDEQQPPFGEMIEPYSEYTNSRRNRRPIQNSYLRSADRFQRTPQRDLSRDTLINDHISQQQTASGLVMIDPDAELINTDANHQNNVYYYYSYVPNNIDQTPRMKRTEPVYQFYQRPVIRYPFPQQHIAFY